TANLFGMGLGRFPETYFFNNPARKPLASYRYGVEAGKTFLALGGGESLYFGQRVHVRSHEGYTVELDIRWATPDVALSLYLCEKNLLYSRNCRSQEVPRQQPGPEWQHYRWTFDTGDIGALPWHSSRPVEFSLTNGAAHTKVEVDNIRLVDASGT